MQSTFILWYAWNRNASLVNVMRGFPQGSVYEGNTVPDFLHHGLAEKGGDHCGRHVVSPGSHKSSRCSILFNKAVFCSESCFAKDAFMHRSVLSERLAKQMAE